MCGGRLHPAPSSGSVVERPQDSRRVIGPPGADIQGRGRAFAPEHSPSASSTVGISRIRRVWKGRTDGRNPRAAPSPTGTVSATPTQPVVSVWGSGQGRDIAWSSMSRRIPPISWWLGSKPSHCYADVSAPLLFHGSRPSTRRSVPADVGHVAQEIHLLGRLVQPRRPAHWLGCPASVAPRVAWAAATMCSSAAACR